MAKISFTAGRVAGFACPPGKTQAFLWDAVSPGLGLRCTSKGKPAYVFQGVFRGSTVRVTIGAPSAWSIPDARAKSRELQRLIDEGHDPRELKREKVAATAARQMLERSKAAAEIQAAITVREAWVTYIAERTPYWGERHLADHLRLAKAGGAAATRGTRGTGMTIAGPLHAFMEMPLRELSTTTVEAWASKEAKVRPTSARLAWRQLRAFLTWCNEHPMYSALVQQSKLATSRRTREALGKAKVKQDSLLREQLPGWFEAVRMISSPTASAYLQTLLITGARSGEIISLRWDDMNLKWKGLTIHDKVEGERVIPLTPYVEQLLLALPRRSEWVFASPSLKPSASSQPISIPSKTHRTACSVAGVEGLTLHGLRRSFKSLTEWLECPAGVVAQIMGHKPSATAEKHYTIRPLDMLRTHHERIEAWMLEQGGVNFIASDGTGKLRAVR